MKYIQRSLVFVLLCSAVGCAGLAGSAGTKPAEPDHKSRWMTVSFDGKQYDLVRYTVADLGFENPAGLREIYAAAEKRGLRLCPERLGIPIRLGYKNQPKNEWLLVAMEEIVYAYPGSRIYRIMNARGQTILDVVRADENARFITDTEFIFVHSKRNIR